MKKSKKLRKSHRKPRRAAKKRVAKARRVQRSKIVRTVESVKINPRRRRRRKAAAKPHPAQKKRTSAKRRSHKASKAGLVAINQGSRVLLCRVSGSKMKRLGTFTRKGLKKWCAKNGVKAR